VSADLEVVHVRPRDGIEYLWRMRFEPQAGEDRPLVAATGGGPFIDLLADCPVRARVDDRGVNVAAAFENADSLPADARPFMDSFIDTIRTIIVPLPREPVGVGARWEVSQVMGMMSLRISHTATYELLAIEDGLLRIRVAAAETATAQSISVPGMGDGAAMELRSLYGHGEGAVTVDPSRLIPRAMSLAIRLEATAELVAGEVRQPLSLKGEMTSRIEAR
jgi:hypothetical protein